MARRIYVGNLPWAYASSDLEAMIKEYGEVAAAAAVGMAAEEEAVATAVVAEDMAGNANAIAARGGTRAPAFDFNVERCCVTSLLKLNSREQTAPGRGSRTFLVHLPFVFRCP